MFLTLLEEVEYLLTSVFSSEKTFQKGVFNTDREDRISAQIAILKFNQVLYVALFFETFGSPNILPNIVLAMATRHNQQAQIRYADRAATSEY